ncbi:MAG TPA: hypothetical protein VEI54_00700 [Candidatus Limnocylindrales bacterium]|nr:hypothetical protein [Candidatus Limnocylindrales bacterium]
MYGPSWFGLPTASSQHLTAARANMGAFNRGRGTIFFPGPGVPRALSGLGSSPSQQTLSALTSFLVGMGYDANNVQSFLQALVQRGATDEDFITILQLEPGEIMAGLAILADRLTSGNPPSLTGGSGVPGWLWVIGALAGVFFLFGRR